MSLLFIKNKSHLISDSKNEDYCELEYVYDAIEFSNRLYELYGDPDFNRDDWVVVRISDLKRVLTRILKSDEIKIIRYCDNEDDKEIRQSEKKYKNQIVKLSDQDSTKIEYKKKCYDFGYDVNPNDLIEKVKNENLFDISDLIEIFNELKIEIDWKRLNQDVVDVKRIMKKRR